MHSGNRITGSVCKCMTCARQRHQALAREALLRDTQAFQEAERDIALAEQVIADGMVQRDEARLRRDNILRDVRTAVLTEAS